MKDIAHFLKQIKLPHPDSHKGQNGKLLIIGGSKLFHAASKWSLDTASKFVDMVFYSSIPSNNKLIQEAKQNFWNGIVVPREEIENYINESDCILIGPGMERAEETEKIVNDLLSKYPNKKWVIDAGALQMVDPKLLNKNCIITPHQQELIRIASKLEPESSEINKQLSLEELLKTVVSNFPILAQTTILLKGPVDQIFHQDQQLQIEGGNAGMTKGGTGDVLAGLVASFYCKHDALISTVVGSYINKKAGDKLFEKVGPYFNASDLVEAIPEILWQEIQ